MSCVAVTTAFLLLAALCIQDTTAYNSKDCEGFRLNVDNQGWQSVTGTNKKLKVVTTPQNYADARTACKGMNGDLASIGHAQAHKVAMCWLQKYHRNMRVWLGGMRVDGAFKWLENGWPIADNWRKGQPDFTGGQEKCLEMNWGEMGLYNDDRCHFKKPFICEYNNSPRW